jgi:nucleoside-diphosphate-sugar epimerase
MTVNVFLTGATGYIGGSLLAELLKDGRFKVSALVRSQDKAKLLQDVGVTPILGTLDDAEIITKSAAAADLVIEAANCDHLENAKAIVAGLEKSYKETGKKAIYVHTSGSGIAVAPNDYPYYGKLDPNVYDDTNDEQISAIPVTNVHRNVDDYIIKHSNSYKLVIATPSLVYGKATVLDGISNTRSLLIPFLIKTALKERYTVQINDGSNTWSNVHINDVTTFYKLLIDALLEDNITTLGAQGYYFIENGEVKVGEIIKKIAEIGHQKGVFDTVDVKSGLTSEELLAYVGNPMYGFFLGTNSRMKANKIKKLGWKPKYGPDGVFTTLNEEFEHWQKQQ